MRVRRRVGAGVRVLSIVRLVAGHEFRINSRIHVAFARLLRCGLASRALGHNILVRGLSGEVRWLLEGLRGGVLQGGRVRGMTGMGMMHLLMWLLLLLLLLVVWVHWLVRLRSTAGHGRRLVWRSAPKGQMRVEVDRLLRNGRLQRRLLVWSLTIVRLVVTRGAAVDGRKLVAVVVYAGCADGPGSLHGSILAVGVGSAEAVAAIGSGVVFVVVEIFVGLILTTAHADVTANANAAALLGDDSAQVGALGETRELLRAVHDERLRLDLQTEGHVSIWCHQAVPGIVRHWLHVSILFFFELLVQVEAEPVLSLVAHREIGEDEVACRHGAVKVGHTGHRRAGEDRERCGHVVPTNGSDGAGGFEGGVQKEVGIVGEGDIVLGLGIEDLQLDDGWRVDGAPVGGGLGSRAASSCTLGLLQDLDDRTSVRKILGLHQRCHQPSSHI